MRFETHRECKYSSNCLRRRSCSTGKDDLISLLKSSPQLKIYLIRQRMSELYYIVNNALKPYLERNQSLISGITTFRRSFWRVILVNTVHLLLASDCQWHDVSRSGDRRRRVEPSRCTYNTHRQSVYIVKVYSCHGRWSEHMYVSQLGMSSACFAMLAYNHLSIDNIMTISSIA